MPSGPAAVGLAPARSAIEDAAGGEFTSDHSEPIVTERIAMTNLLTGETFGRQTTVSDR